jgi:hypothetical protein
LIRKDSIVLIDNQPRKQIALAMHEPKRIPARAQQRSTIGCLADSSLEKAIIDFRAGITRQKPERNEGIRMKEPVADRGAIALPDKRHDRAGLDVFRKVEQFVAEGPKMAAQQAEFFLVANADVWIMRQWRMENYELRIQITKHSGTANR